MLLLKQNITKKKQVYENVIKLNIDNKSKEYKMKIIYNSVAYAKELKSGYLQGLDYLVS